MRVDDEPFVEGLDHALRDESGLVLCAFHQDRELIAAQPGDRVTGSHAADNPLSHLNQQCVASRMTEVVVDELEIVKVQRQHRHRLVVALMDLQRMRQAVVKEHPIRQAGQWVAQRLIRHRLQQTPILPDHDELPRQHRAH